MQSEIGVPKSYLLSITRSGNTVDATLKSASGDYDCTFTGLRGDSDGFEFGPTGGYFSCKSGGLICDTYRLPVYFVIVSKAAISTRRSSGGVMTQLIFHVPLMSLPEIRP